MHRNKFQVYINTKRNKQEYLLMPRFRNKFCMQKVQDDPGSSQTRALQQGADSCGTRPLDYLTNAPIYEATREMSSALANYKI